MSLLTRTKMKKLLAMAEASPSNIEMTADHPGTYALPHHGPNYLISFIVPLFQGCHLLRIPTVLT